MSFMLLCNINFPENIPERFALCVEFIKKFNNSPLPAGRYDLSGGSYVNVCEYQTTEEKNCVKEAHRKYIDIHYVALGTELAKQAFINSVTEEFYKEDDDYVAVLGSFNNTFVLKTGDIFIAYPEDAHLTRANAGGLSAVKKLIFKVPVTGTKL